MKVFTVSFLSYFLFLAPVYAAGSTRPAGKVVVVVSRRSIYLLLVAAC